MYRGKVTMMAAAVFAIGVAFAAQPTSERADRRDSDTQERNWWIPGTNGVMAVHDSELYFAPPPPQ
jgi:hypothetical protein